METTNNRKKTTMKQSCRTLRYYYQMHRLGYPLIGIYRGLHR